jgi:hypothetical protein
MEVCSGRTLNGTRCKCKPVQVNEYHELYLPVCRFHVNQNVVYKWSEVDYTQSEAPTLVKNFLAVYYRCREHSVKAWTAIRIASEIVNVTDVVDAPAEVLLFTYFTRILKDVQTDDDCPICLETQPESVRTKCGHVFCRPCISQWVLKNTGCPLCRKIIS